METAQDEAKLPAVSAVKRSLLSVEKRTQYIKALNELVGELPLNDYQFVDEKSFCERYDLRPSFFEALRDLDGLEMNCLGDPGWYKKTPTLYKLTPEQVLIQMRNNAHKTHKASQDAETPKPPESVKKSAPIPVAVTEWQKMTEIKQTTPDITLSSVGKPTPLQQQMEDQLREIGEEVQTILAEEKMEPIVKKHSPVSDLTDPYTIRIESKKIDLRFEVQNQQDVATVSAIISTISN